MSPEDRASLLVRANALAGERMCAADPVLVAVRPALEVVPDMTPRTVLTSGPELDWPQYTGGQRRAVIGGAIFERLADDPDEVDTKIGRGEITVAPCQQYACIGSLAGVYTASMPVLVVDNANGGNRAYCTLFEGASPHRLNYGVYNAQVRENLELLGQVIGPTLDDAVTHTGGIPLRPIIRRALHLGDELHSRNTAATMLFTRDLFPALLDLGPSNSTQVRRTLDYLQSGDYFFLRLSMAASKVAADAAHGIHGSSVVTSMAFNCRQFGIRVSGLGDGWFQGPLPSMADAKLFDGHDTDEIEFMGGESTINETVGLGGFAQAAAFPLQRYQGGEPDHMVRTNREMYDITIAEHPDFQIPYMSFRGVPVGIDVERVVGTGITPALDIGIAGRNGGQIGAGSFRAPVEPFREAWAAYVRKYSEET
ncbi:MAG: DUF1116 domain-containing protein [Solirubrobacteraceae bacterium]